MQFKDLLYQRRSTRSFTGQMLNMEQLNELLEAATRAPNACNAQSWHFFCSIDSNIITGLSASVYNNDWINKAGAVIVVCTNVTSLAERFGGTTANIFATQDAAAAMSNILLRASDIGLAGCWVGAFNNDACVKYFDIPKGMKPIAIAVLGYAAADVPLSERKPQNEVITIVGETTE